MPIEHSEPLIQVNTNAGKESNGMTSFLGIEIEEIDLVSRPGETGERLRADAGVKGLRQRMAVDVEHLHDRTAA